jgi:hypothetical protein
MHATKKEKEEFAIVSELADINWAWNASNYQIRFGRVILLHDFGNMAYVWELQDTSQITEREKEV